MSDDFAIVYEHPTGGTAPLNQIQIELKINEIIGEKAFAVTAEDSTYRVNISVYFRKLWNPFENGGIFLE